MLAHEKPFWREKVFGFISAAAILYAVLTLTAMLFYPGGTLSDPTTHGYSFFKNFFSDLGVLHTTSGAANYVSAALFFPAMTLAGFALILFSSAFPQFFTNRRKGYIRSAFGSISGTMAGICFVGVALTPADVLLNAHLQFSIWAFRLFLVAVLFWGVAVFRHGQFPKLYGWIYLGFAALLLGYVFLMRLGPSPKDTVLGTMIQATGQKIISYASLACVLIQAQGAKALNKSDSSHK